MAEIINFLSNATVLTVFVGYVFAIWVGLVVWTWVDIARRTDNYFYRYAMVLLVAFGAFVGFAFYLMIRPTLTKKEVEAQRLEEQFLLATSSFSSCQNCGQVSPSDFLFCVNCATQLRDKCLNCGSFMSLDWLACPNCGTKKLDKVLMPAPVEVVADRQTVSVVAARRLPRFSLSLSSVFASLAHLVPASPTSINGDSRKANAKKTSSSKKTKSRPKKVKASSKSA